MPRLKHALPVAGALATWWDRSRRAVKLALGLTTPPILLPYLGYATKDGLVFGGRVIEDEAVIGAAPTRSATRNLWRTFRRYETDEIEAATIEWSLDGRTGRVSSDRQGFFSVESDLPLPAAAGPWATARLTLEAAPGYRFEPVVRAVAVRVVGPEAAFGIISDIDDTIVQTGAQTFRDHFRTVALNSADGRVAFKGVSLFYAALVAGQAGPETNPIFYVSSSPWNLHDLFEDFMAMRGIPKGPLFLKDFGLDATQWLTGSHATHKVNAVRRILAACPDLPFVLIGDTGQSDAIIYAAIVEAEPGRIVSVHLRDVTPAGFKPRVGAAIAAIEAAGVAVTSSPTLIEAARATERLGLVAPGTTAAMEAAVG